MDQELKVEINEATNLQYSGSNVQPVEHSDGFIQKLLKKFTENKMYLYITITVIVLCIVLYYFYKKSKKELKYVNDKPLLALPKQKSDEYFVLDENGNPVKVSESFSNQQLLPLPMPKQQPSQQDIQMLQKQMLEKQQMQQHMQQQMQQQQMQQQQMQQQQMQHQQMQQQQMQQQQMQQQQMQQQQFDNSRSKLQHPDSEEHNNESDDINIELARIQANEDDNVTQHNLTNSELAEINKKIEMMNSQNK